MDPEVQKLIEKFQKEGESSIHSKIVNDKDLIKSTGVDGQPNPLLEALLTSTAESIHDNLAVLKDLISYGFGESKWPTDTIYKFFRDNCGVKHSKTCASSKFSDSPIGPPCCYNHNLLIADLLVKKFSKKFWIDLKFKKGKRKFNILHAVLFSSMRESEILYFSKIFITIGVDPFYGEGCLNPFGYFIQFGFIDIIRQLILDRDEKDISFNIKNPIDGTNPLIESLKADRNISEHVAMLKLALKYGFDPYLQYNGETINRYRNHEKVTKLLPKYKELFVLLYNKYPQIKKFALDQDETKIQSIDDLLEKFGTYVISDKQEDVDNLKTLLTEVNQIMISIQVDDFERTVIDFLKKKFCFQIEHSKNNKTENPLVTLINYIEANLPKKEDEMENKTKETFQKMAEIHQKLEERKEKKKDADSDSDSDSDSGSDSD